MGDYRNERLTVKGKATYAWAAVAKKDGKLLRDLRGHYGIYTHREDAVDDCPMYGQVRRVRITLAPIAVQRSTTKEY